MRVVHRRADVVTAALRVLDRYGLELFSMRRLAGELGVAPSALYHHVEDKQTLLGLMAERIVEPVEFGPDLAEVSRRLRSAMLAVRDGAEVVATATAFRIGSSPVEVRLAAHSSPDVARTLLIYVVGHTQMTQLHRQAAGLGMVPAEADLDGSFDRGLRIVLGSAAG